MGVSGVFTLLLCGNTTFPWAVAFVSATMGLTTFSHRYWLASHSSTFFLDLNVNSVFFFSTKISVSISCFHVTVLVTPFETGTFISITMRTATHHSLLDIRVLCFHHLYSVCKSACCHKLCHPVLSSTRFIQGELGSISAYIRPAVREFSLEFNPHKTADLLNCFVFCTLALTT